MVKVYRRAMDTNVMINYQLILVDRERKAVLVT